MIFMTDEAVIVGYCFKCKEKRPIHGSPKAEWASNGSPGTRGTCPVCSGTNMYKRGHTPAHENLPKPEIQPRPKGTQ